MHPIYPYLISREALLLDALLISYSLSVLTENP
jgi:hypothetical protein